MISKYQEKVAKGRGIIKEVNESFKAVNLEDTTKQLVQVRLIIFIFSRANALLVKAHWEWPIDIFQFLHENLTFYFKTLLATIGGFGNFYNFY